MAKLQHADLVSFVAAAGPSRGGTLAPPSMEKSAFRWPVEPVHRTRSPKDGLPRAQDRAPAGRRAP